MNLVVNNLKGLGIQLVMSILAFILTTVAYMILTIYNSQIIPIIVTVLLYICYLIIYLKLSTCLKLDDNKKNDYMVGILAFIIGVGIWGLSVYYSVRSINYILESLEIYWVPYNLYIFASWPFLSGQENVLILLMGSLSPVILLSLGMKIKRYRLNS